MNDRLTIRPAAAAVRAVFVRPGWERRGIGRALVGAAEAAARAAGFGDAVLVATLAGEPLFAACGYAVAGRYDVALPGGLALPVVRMVRRLGAGSRRAGDGREPPADE